MEYTYKFLISFGRRKNKLPVPSVSQMKKTLQAIVKVSWIMPEVSTDRSPSATACSTSRPTFFDKRSIVFFLPNRATTMSPTARVSKNQPMEYRNGSFRLDKAKHSFARLSELGWTCSIDGRYWGSYWPKIWATSSSRGFCLISSMSSISSDSRVSSVISFTPFHVSVFGAEGSSPAGGTVLKGRPRAFDLVVGRDGGLPGFAVVACVEVDCGQSFSWISFNLALCSDVIIMGVRLA